ncbi:glutamate receptor 2.8-like [Rutidosis leptorrhynchoides]|uniref:glutamate receptor 2.8-like n=1 Tax=Rutidosis leptorrhynchoides TaxID=125765 RepID=UPI003A99DB96
MSILIVCANNGNCLICSNSQHVVRAIGDVVEKSSRVRTEQPIAMEMAIHDFCKIKNRTCSCPVLNNKNSQGNMVRLVYEVIDVMERNQVEAIIGTISPQQATLVAEFTKAAMTIPIVNSTWVAVKAIQVLKGLSSTRNKHESISHSEFIDLSGNVSLKSGKLTQQTFHVINVIGRGYREIGIWSSGSCVPFDNLESRKANLGLIFLPSETHIIPTGNIHSPEKVQKQLKIGVPAEAVFNQFVNVIYDPNKNKTYVTGFTIKVLEGVMKQLPYAVSYVMVPYKGTYDDLLAGVYNKTLDMVIGDIEITSYRYQYADFSQPYMETEIVMVAPMKKDTYNKGFIFLYAFTSKLWIVLLAMTVGTASVIWFNEHVHENMDFKGSSTFEYITNMLWFAVAVLSLSQREPIKNDLSRLALATWFCVNMIVAVCFSATLSLIITDSRFHPTQKFHGNNYIVGCVENSFISRYLVNVLHFSPKNLRHFKSIEGFHEAFKKREIDAAFFVSPHANVFLAKYCEDYQNIVSTKLSGFSFAFQKGSTLTRDFSEAILKVIETTEITYIEKNMLKSLSKCSQLSQEQESNGPLQLDLTDFTGLFIILGCVSTFVFIAALNHLIAKHPDAIWRLIQSNLITRRIGKLIALLLQIRVVLRDLGVELTPNQATA